MSGFLPLALVFAGCVRPPEPDTGTVTPPPDTGSPLDSVPVDTDEPPVDVDSVGDQPDAGLDDAFFSTDTVHTVAITLPPEGITALGLSPYDKTLGDVTIDGVVLTGVGVRLRGKIGSFRTLDGKPKFAIDVNYTNVDQRYYGLEEISLNNEVVDCGYLREPLAYRIFHDAGIAAPRTGFARVSVNGADYGLYVVVETPDDRFIKRNYTDTTGNLYDGKYVYYEDHSYTLLDFTTLTEDLFQLEEGTDVGNTDVYAVVSAIANIAEPEDWYDALATLVDLRQVETYLVVEELVGHNDGYALNTNNYRFYFDPADAGRMTLIPWDFDYGFLHDYEWGFRWTSPNGVLAGSCFQNTRCSSEHKNAIRVVLANYDVAALQAWFDGMQARIANDAATDPRRECGIDSVLSYQAAARSWIATEPDELKATWGLQ